MSLKMRKDIYLDFLQTRDKETLDVLVKLITADKDGNARFTEELTKEECYKTYHPNHGAYWHLIVANYQMLGGYPLFNALRGYGATYEEILTDVCVDMRINLPEKASIEIKENELLQKFLETALEKMTMQEKEEFLRNLNIKTQDFSKQAVLTALQNAVKQSGAMAYQIAATIANAIAKSITGHGLRLSVNERVICTLGIIAEPIGWIITTLCTARVPTGVTIPATIYIAALRQAELNKNHFLLSYPYSKRTSYYFTDSMHKHQKGKTSSL